MTNKIICSIFFWLMISACSSNAMDNLNTTNPETTSNKFELVTTYKSSKLEKYVKNNYICKTGDNDDACSANTANLESQFNFKLDQITENVSKVQAYSVIYQSRGLNNEERTLSGGVLVPDMPQDKIKGVILYFHPTEVSKFNVPSCFFGASNLPEYCKIESDTVGSSYAMELGGIFATQGYIVVMPDYIGQGIDSSIMHPYVAYPEINAKSGINMLASTRKILDSLGYDSSTKLNLFITGYSEGGAYSLWASHILQSSGKQILSKYNYNLGLTAPISGAYDLAGTQVPMEFANLSSYPNPNNKFRTLSIDDVIRMKPIVSSYLLTSLAYYNLNKIYAQVFTPEFLSCERNCTFGGKHHTISDLFTTTDADANTKNISSSIVKATLSSISADNDQLYAESNNSLQIIAADDLLNNKVFNKVLKKASLVTWKTKAPVTFIYLDYDSIVTPLNSERAFAGMSKVSDKKLVNKIKVSNFDYYTAINNNNKSKDVKPIDHMGCRGFLYIPALNEFNKYK